MGNIFYLQCDMRYNPYMLEKINGKTAIEYTLDKVQELGQGEIVAGIYRCDENIELIKLLESKRVKVIISDIINVTERMIDAVRYTISNYVIRIGGDMCLLDVKTTKHIMDQVCKGEYDYFYYDGLSSCVPDMIKTSILVENEEILNKKNRYMDALEEMEGIERYITEIPLHSMCYPIRANSKGGIYRLEHIIKNHLDIYELSNHVICGINAINSELVKTGLLGEWGLPQDKKMFFYDEAGNVNPWLAMSAVELLKEKVTKEHCVFEWGAGNSTLFWAQRAKSVVSIEIDEAWCNKVSNKVDNNVTIKYIDYEKNSERYGKAILDEELLFDIILIDGMYDRDICARSAVKRIKNTGVIIVDNTDVEEYADAVHFLEQEGFFHLKLKGFMYGWIGHYCTTSLFYKKGNFMNL